jgi:hypothetical protein
MHSEVLHRAKTQNLCSEALQGSLKGQPTPKCILSHAQPLSPNPSSTYQRVKKLHPSCQHFDCFLLSASDTQTWDCWSDLVQFLSPRATVCMSTRMINISAAFMLMWKGRRPCISCFGRRHIKAMLNIHCQRSLKSELPRKILASEHPL